MVKAALSMNAGHTFSKPIIVSEQESLGRVDAAIYHRKVFVSWIEKANGQTLLKLKRVGFGQSTPKVITAGQMSGGQKTGFPQLELLGNQLLMAWTVWDSTGSDIKTVKVDLPI